VNGRASDGLQPADGWKKEEVSKMKIVFALRKNIFTGKTVRTPYKYTSFSFSSRIKAGKNSIVKE
jgi:hypothetical protein